MKLVFASLVVGCLASAAFAESFTPEQLCAEKAEVIRVFKKEMSSPEKSFFGDLIYDYDCKPVKELANREVECLKILTTDFEKTCQK